MEIEQIPAVQASDMPREVEDWCVENDYSIHYQNDIAQVENDGNPFAEWLIENGYKFKAKKANKDSYGGFDSIGIFAT